MSFIREALWEYPDLLIPIIKRNNFLFLIIASLSLGFVLMATTKALFVTQKSQVFDENVYSEGYVGDALKIDPILPGLSSYDTEITQLVYSSLVKVNTNGEMVPELSETWSISSDGKSYTMYLRQGVKWHDGFDFTSKDVLTTFELIKAAGPSLPSGQILKDVTITTPDKYTIVFSLPQANAAFLELLTVGIIPDHEFSGYTYTRFASDAPDMMPIGTGPYMFVQNQDNVYTFKTNTHYFLAKPKIETVLIKNYKSIDKAEAALKRGEFYTLANVNPGIANDLSKYKTLSINKYTLSNNTRILYFNMTLSKPTLSRNVRRAVASAIDKLDLSQLITGSEVAYGPYAANSWVYNRNIELILPNNIAAADKMLNDDGWILDRSTGKRYKDKLPLVLTITFLDNPTNQQVVNQLKQYLAQVNIQLESNPVTGDILIQNTLPNRDFELLLFEAQTSTDPDLYTMWHSSQAKYPGLNISGYNSNRLDGFLEKGRIITNQDRRRAIYGDLQEFLATEVPAVFLYHPPYYEVSFDIIKKPENDTSILSGERLLKLTSWSIEPRWRNWQTR